jgi:hypothetical protein
MSGTQTVGPFQFCVPDAFADNPATYCSSGGFQDFIKVAALEAGEDKGICDATLDVSCSPVNLPGGPTPVAVDTLCEGTCPSIVCNSSNCTPQQLLNNTCDCTAPAACDGFSTMVACTPGFFERQAGMMTLQQANSTPANALSVVTARSGTWNRAGSQLDVTVSVDILCAPIIGCATTTDSASAAAQGTLNLYGPRCPGGSCDLALDSQIVVDDFDLEFSLGPISQTHSVRNLAVQLRTPRNSLHINPDGSGVIPAGMLSITATARHVGGGDDDTFRALNRSNTMDLPVNINWATNSITVPSIAISFADGSGTVRLAGTFQPSLIETVAAADFDADGVPNGSDNCPLVSNPTQTPVRNPVITVPPDVRTCGEAVFTPATAEDICFGAPFELTSNAPAAFPAGTTVVTFTATDVVGNQNTATQIVEERPALLALRSLFVRDRAVVNGAPGLSKIINLGSAIGTDVGVEATVGNLLSNANVSLRDRSTVLGDLITRGTAQRGNGVRILGQTLTGTPLPLGAFPELTIPPFTPGTLDVNLEPDTTRTLNPGSYRNVSVKSRATLTLRPGTYALASFALEPQARVNVSGSTTLLVRDLVQLRGDFVRSGGAAVTILFTGANTIGAERPFAGRIVAPRAGVFLGAGSSLMFSGSIVANDIELRPDVNFTCRP